VKGIVVMKRLRFGLVGSLLFAAVALLAGCAAWQSPTGVSGALPQDGNTIPLRLQRDAALAVPHYLQRAVYPDHGARMGAEPTPSSSGTILKAESRSNPTVKIPETFWPSASGPSQANLLGYFKGETL
jgi:hypothetical protein